MHPSDPRFPRDEIEAARYYLSPAIAVELAGGRSGPAASEHVTTYDAYCLAKPRDEQTDPDAQRFPGLLVTKRQADRARIENGHSRENGCSTTLPEKGDQVGHLLKADGLFESLGHEGLAGGSQLVDLGPEDGFLNTLGAAELRGGRRTLRPGGPRYDLAVLCGDRDSGCKIGRDLAIGVEYVDQQSVGARPAMPDRSGPTR